jgi:hypothetical protein
VAFRFIKRWRPGNGNETEATTFLADGGHCGHGVGRGGFTDAMVSIEGEAMRSVTWVVVEEVKSGDWGVGGKPITTSDVKALAAGKQA